jgi:ATP-dependent Clp protease ATP-binding subunit ClpC
MPIIMNGAFPIIGATYPRELKEYLEPRTDFMGMFELIRMQEITEEEAGEVLVYQAMLLEQQYKVTVSFGAIKEAVGLAKRHFREKLLPSSAAELLKEAIVEAERKGAHFIGIEEIVAVAEAKTNVPLHSATKVEAGELLHLEDTIHERYIDQEEAVKAVANALREYRSGIARGKGPIATFLFVGPSGVGKTELAKIVAQIQFGSESAMVRFDMTEYQDRESAHRLIGSPDGTVSGALTEAVRQKPYSLILLDEFEKAFPDILNLFLQVFDDARLTDNLSRTIDFQNTIIIATSNAHSDIINDALGRGESMTAIAEYLKKKLVDVMKPELINRFSRIVVFKDLSPKDLDKIASLALEDLQKSLKEQSITLTFGEGVTKKVAQLGYDPVFGARPLRRVIEDKIRAPLASELLKRGGEREITINIEVSGDEFAFSSNSSSQS